LVHSQNAYKISVGKSEGKSPRRELRHKWKDDIKVDLKFWCEVLNWFHVAQDKVHWRPVLDTIVNHRVS